MIGSAQFPLAVGLRRQALQNTNLMQTLQLMSICRNMCLNLINC